MATALKKVTATGLVITGPVFLRSVMLTAAAATSTVLVQDTSAGGGTDVLSISAVANTSQEWQSGDDDRGVFFAKGIYATLSGASAAVSVEFEA